MATIRSRHCDVAVVGGGAVGLVFAIRLKAARPQTRIIVLERNASPAFKVGESLTATAAQHLRQAGLSDQVLGRLCRRKEAGQSFWWTGYGSAEVGHHLNSRVSATYHVERRPLEIALSRLAERAGVEVLRAVPARVEHLAADGGVLRCQPDDGSEFTVRATIVCDASGPASVVPRALGHYRPGPGGLADFNCTAYYGHFEALPGTAPRGIPHWTVDATSHVCFPQGWMWVIALTSWQQSPGPRLGQLADHLLDHRDAPDVEIPSRSALEGRFSCPSADIVSIGVTVRDDDDTARCLPANERFDHYIGRYPGLARVMEGFRLATPYGPRFKQRRHIAHHSDQAAGDGWIAMGDAAGFVNPLFSPGLRDGLRQAAAAVPVVAAALDEGRAARGCFAAHERTVNGLVSIAFRENEMLYRAFRHPAAYERTMSLRLLVGALIVLRLGRLPIPPSEWEPIWGRYLGVLDQVIAVERQADAGNWAGRQLASALDSVIDPFTAWMRGQEVVQRARLGGLLSHYTDDLQWRPAGRTDGDPSAALGSGAAL